MLLIQSPIVLVVVPTVAQDIDFTYLICSPIITLLMVHYRLIKSAIWPLLLFDFHLEKNIECDTGMNNSSE